MLIDDVASIASELSRLLGKRAWACALPQGDRTAFSRPFDDLRTSSLKVVADLRQRAAARMQNRRMRLGSEASMFRESNDNAVAYLEDLQNTLALQEIQLRKHLGLLEFCAKRIAQLDTACG